MEKFLLPPNESVAEVIKREIKEVDDKKLEHNVKLFEQWIECQPHFPKDYEKHMLTTYIRGTKHDLETAKRKMEIYFVGKDKIADIYSYQPYTEEELKFANNVSVAVTPHLTEEGYRVTVFNVRDSNPNCFDTKITLQNIWRFAHLRICKEHLTAGDIYVFDAGNISPAHLPKLLIPEFKRAVFMAQEGFALRIGQIHVVNAPAYIDKFLSVIKMLLKEKLRIRIFVDRGISSLKNIIGEKSLPKDYGGIAEPSHDLHLKWMKYIDDNKDWFLAQNDVKASGPIPKHLVSCLGNDGDLGVQGSFRQLSID